MKRIILIKTRRLRGSRFSPATRAVVLAGAFVLALLAPQAAAAKHHETYTTIDAPIPGATLTAA
jgi:hypothetical protein